MVFDNYFNVVYNNSRNDIGVYVRPVVIILRIVQFARQVRVNNTELFNVLTQKPDSELREAA